MNTEESKIRLSEIITRLCQQEYVSGQDAIMQELKELQQDIDKDFFTVVVLGEFKRGKSTFVNAMLGQELLPADVLPTTSTINALMYDQKQLVEVVYQDGTVERGTASQEYLNQFSAGKLTDVSQVKYLKIGCQADILKDNVIIVDTPGVSDINEQRVQVTYDFIPKANAVVFLLDAAAPLKNTEKEFIERHLLDKGINNILFVANKFDQIDEEEDGDVLGEVVRRMKSAFKDEAGKSRLENIELLPLSAKMALQGRLTRNQDLIKVSGIQEVEAKLKEIVFKGEMTCNKTARYKQRLEDILAAIIRSIANEMNVKKASEADINEALANLEKIINGYEENKKAIAAYVAEEQETILSMTDKSLLHFHKKLQDAVEEQVNCYNGTDFKDFVEQQVSKLLKRNMESWVDTYSQYIDQLLLNLESTLAKGLTSYFNTQINLRDSYHDGTVSEQRFNFVLEADDVSKASLQAGAITAGGAGLIMLVGGPILMPFVSMLAYPFLQRRFLKSRLAEAKAQIKPMINEQLIQAMNNLRDAIHKSIEQRIAEISSSTECAYMEMLQKIREQLRNQVKDQETNRDSLYTEMELLETTKADMENYIRLCKEA